MKPVDASFAASVRAFRDMTAAPAEGAATRARVLARRASGAERRRIARRAAVCAIAIVIASSAAWTAAARLRWRPAPVPIIAASNGSELADAAARRPMRIIPKVRAEPLQTPVRLDGESRAYGRAHRAHFADDQPAVALAAWDAYLALYPRGTFAPEAHYNRALCLVRLGRFSEAARALRPFARGGFGDYRRQEATTLLDWIGDRAGEAPRRR